MVQFEKRLFDLIFATLGSLVLLLLLPIVAVAIWLDAGRPIFYRQERVGLHGRRFWIYKFRTMENGDDVTKTGRFLRRTHLDELPQLWNILKGEMSMVGPAPSAPNTWKNSKRKSQTTPCATP